MIKCSVPLLEKKLLCTAAPRISILLLHTLAVYSAMLLNAAAVQNHVRITLNCCSMLMTCCCGHFKSMLSARAVRFNAAGETTSV